MNFIFCQTYRALTYGVTIAHPWHDGHLTSTKFLRGWGEGVGSKSQSLSL